MLRFVLQNQNYMKHSNNKFKNTSFWIDTPFGSLSLYQVLEAKKTSFEYLPAKWYVANGEHTVKAFKVSNKRRTGENDFDVYLTFINQWGLHEAKVWAGNYQEYLDYTTENERAYNIANEIGL